MKFPILKLSDTHWTTAEDAMLYIHSDPFIYSKDEDGFKKYFFRQKYIDSEGRIFIVTGRKLPNELWRKILRFIPFVYKVELVFTKVSEVITENGLKRYLLNKLYPFSSDEVIKYWIERIERATTYEEVISP